MIQVMVWIASDWDIIVDDDLSHVAFLILDIMKNETLSSKADPLLAENTFRVTDLS